MGVPYHMKDLWPAEFGEDALREPSCYGVAADWHEERGNIERAATLRKMQTAVDSCEAARIYHDDVSRGAVESYFSTSEYDPIINAIGNKLIQVDDSGYEGDSRVLYRDGDRYGWLQFGWGSCSGCDALRGCDTIEQVQSLLDDLRNSVRWFESADECREFFRTHDWEGDYSWHSDEQREFVRQVLELLKEPTP